MIHSIIKSLKSLRLRLAPHNRNDNKIIFLYAGIIAVMAIASFAARAQEYSSTNFIIRDALVAPQGGARSSSPTYEVYGATGVLAPGESSSSTFTLRSGSLYYPAETTPVVTAVPGNSTVALSWTAATAELAGSITEYEVGQATTSGGPYTFTSVGNVLASTRSGLTGGTAYYFVVRALDAQGNYIVTSSEASATTTSTSPSIAGGSGGGFVPVTGVLVAGTAYPLSKVIILKDGERQATTIAGPDARFEVRVEGLSAGNYIFGVLSEDKDGARSTLQTFPIELSFGSMASVRGIFIAPSVATDKKEVRRGETITVFGQSVPQAEVTININSAEELFARTKADKEGVYVYALDTSPLALGGHTVKAKSSHQGLVSPFGVSAAFAVSAKKTLITKKPKVTCTGMQGDLNNDCRVNIVDFSIMAYWYKRPSPKAHIDMNGDGVVNIIDFSILAFYWSG